MKKKVITTLLAVAMITASTTTTHAANSNQNSVLTGCAVTVSNWTTPSIFSGGRDWPITIWYFYRKDGQVLGSISGSDAMGIMQRDTSGDTIWETWLAGAFNEYRENAASIQSKSKISSSRESNTEEAKNSSPKSSNLTRPQDIFDN